MGFGLWSRCRGPRAGQVRSGQVLVQRIEPLTCLCWARLQGRWGAAGSASDPIALCVCQHEHSLSNASTQPSIIYVCTYIFQACALLVALMNRWCDAKTCIVIYLAHHTVCPASTALQPSQGQPGSAEPPRLGLRSPSQLWIRHLPRFHFGP